MKNTYKRILGFILTCVFTLQFMLLGSSVALANPAEDDLPDISPKTGFELEESIPTETNRMLTTYSNSADKVYTVSDTITATLSGDTLTVSGTGPIPDYTQENPAPWYDDRLSIYHLEIQDGITKIGDMTFAFLYMLDTATMTDTVTEIGQAAFYQNSFLRSITLSKNIQKLGEGAFAYSAALSNIVNLEYVKHFSNYSLQNTTISNLKLGNDTTFDSDAFFNTKIGNIEVESGNPNYSSKNGVLYSKDGTILILYPSNKLDSHYSAEGVTEIADYAFQASSNLKSVDLNGVQKIGEGAFLDSGIESLIIPDSVTEVGYFTFSRSNIKSLKLGNGLEELSYHMFKDCRSLESIDFGNYVKSLDGGQVFENCTSLKSIHLPSQITNLGRATFRGCTSLESFSSQSISHIAFDAFRNCTNLKSVVLNEGITDIYTGAFMNTRALQSISIPSTVKYIHEDAFLNSNALITINNDLLKKQANGSYKITNNLYLSGQYRYDYAYEVLRIANEERAKQGLAPLKMDQSLLDGAMLRAAETHIFFSHTRPNGESPFGVASNAMGENIASYYVNPEHVMNGWMNSTGHRQNILGAGYTTIGVGAFEYKGSMAWVQLFGTNDLSTEYHQPSNKQVVQELDIPVGQFKDYDGNDISHNFEILHTSKNLVKGQSQTLGLSVNRVTVENQGLIWTSSNPKVASVDQNGKVTALSQGKTTISVSTNVSSIASLEINVSSLNGWHLIEGKYERYYTNGVAATGFTKINNTTYLFDADGNKQYGWHVVNGAAVYLSPEHGGGLITGKRKIGNTTYLLTFEGKKYGWHNLEGRHYYFSPEHGGGMVTGKRKIGNTTYILHNDGYKLYGWHRLEGKDYYFDPNFGGGLVTGFRTINGARYEIHRDGYVIRRIR